MPGISEAAKEDILCLIMNSGDIYHFGKKVETPLDVVNLLQDRVVNALPDDTGKLMDFLRKLRDACEKGGVI